MLHSAMRFVGLVVAIFPLIGSAQAAEHDDIEPVVLSFNPLADRYAEVRFRFSDVSSDYWRTTRELVCQQLDTDVGRASVNAIANMVSESTITGHGALQDTARNGDRFTDFLRQENEILASYGFNNNARNLALHLAIAYRRPLATFSDSDRSIDRVTQFLSAQNLAHGLTLLCSPSHSPTHNQSDAGWLTWGWAATKFLGGLAMVAANTLSGAATGPVAAMSVTLGGIMADSGYGDLEVLLSP